MPKALKAANEAWALLEQEEENMNTTTTTPNVDLVRNARSHMTSAIWSTSREYTQAMEEKYGLSDDRRFHPKNAEELIEKIKEGKYTAPDVNAQDYDPDDYRWEPYFGITFRDPAIKKDREGYAKVMDAFHEEKAAIELKINVLEPADALKFVEAFRSKHTLH